MKETSRTITARYINLDQSQDRRLQFETSIERSGLKGLVERFSALHGDGRSARISQSELGCFLSHQSVLNEGGEDSHLLVLEDDVVLNPSSGHRILSLLNKTDAIGWDILFLGQTPDIRDLQRINNLLNLKWRFGNIHRENFSSFKLLDGVRFISFGCFAYIINRNSRSKVRHLVQNAASDGYAEAIDDLYAQLIRRKRLSAKIVFPYIVGLDANLKSTMYGRKYPGANSIHVAMANLFWADVRSYNYSHKEDATIVSDAVYKWLTTVGSEV